MKSKKIISVICILSLILSILYCQKDKKDICDIEVGQIYDYKFDDSEIPDFETINDVIKFVIDYMSQSSDLENHGVINYWQLPEESYLYKTGDCEDFCIFFLYLLKTRLNKDGNIILIRAYGEVHALVQLSENDYVDVNVGSRKKSIEEICQSYQLLYIIPYPEAIWMAYYYHNRVGKYCRN